MQFPAGSKVALQTEVSKARANLAIRIPGPVAFFRALAMARGKPWRCQRPRRYLVGEALLRNQPGAGRRAQRGIELLWGDGGVPG